MPLNRAQARETRDRHEAAPLLQEPEIPGLVWGYRFDSHGRASQLTALREADLGELDTGFVWLHFNLSDARACRWIAAAKAMPESARSFLLDKDQHPQLRLEGEFISAVVSDIELDFEQPTDRLGRVMVVLGPRLLISGRRAPLHGLQAARALIERGVPIRGPIGLLEAIVASATDSMGKVASRLVEDVDAIEDRLLDERIGDERLRLGPIRRTAVRLHRQLLGILGMLRRVEQDGSLAAFPADFAQAHSRLTQRIEALDHEVVALVERARLVHDEIDAMLMAETNRSLHTLTILTTLFLPPTVLAGFFGMNLKAMPFADDAMGFWWAVLMSMLSSAATYALIRHLRKARRR